MKASKLLLFAIVISLFISVANSCKEPNSEAQDVGNSVGNGDGYQDSGSGETEDHPGQNIGSDVDSTSGESGDQKNTPSNY